MRWNCARWRVAHGAAPARHDRAAVVATGPSEPVIPEILPFTAPHTYALVDTLEGLDHWIEAAEQAGIGRDLGGAERRCRHAARRCAAWRWRWRRVSPPMCRSGIAQPELLDAGGAAGLSLDGAIARLKPLLEDPGVLKIGHDVKGAAHLLRRYGIALAPYDCTMLMSYVLDGGQFEHTIEELIRRALRARARLR